MTRRLFAAWISTRYARVIARTVPPDSGGAIY